MELKDRKMEKWPNKNSEQWLSLIPLHDGERLPGH